uniref:Serine/threonine-protein kinase PBS1 n=1 Tax=Rhizophora mucronata TaxID=61149 RepID=A0A2P2MND6_RHIMU
MGLKGVLSSDISFFSELQILYVFTWQFISVLLGFNLLLKCFTYCFVIFVMYRLHYSYSSSPSGRFTAVQ